MSAFWSLVVEPGKVYKRTVDSGISVTRVALDTSAANLQKDEGLCQVILDYEGKPMTVANLSIKHGCFQTELDLTFNPGEEISFSTSGVKLPVTLTGSAGMNFDYMDESDEEVEEQSDDELETEESELGTLEKLAVYSNGKDEEDDDYLVGETTLDDMDDTLDESTSHIDTADVLKVKKRKLKQNDQSSKFQKTEEGRNKIKTIADESLADTDEEDEEFSPSMEKEVDDDESDEDELETEEDNEDDDDDEQEDEEEDLQDENLMEEDSMLEEEEDEDSEEGDIDDLLDSQAIESEEESDEEMEEDPSPVKAVKKAAMNGQKSKKVKELSDKTSSTPKQTKAEKLKAKENKNNSPATPKGKNQGKQNLSPPSKDGKKEGKTPKGDKKNKGENKENSTPKSDKKNKDGKTPKSEKPSKQMRPGGVQIEDIAVGKGQAAKNSSMVSVYYEGRLKNGKMFDKTASGPPFKFRLGKGEVIRGWDVGVQGMQVGGKRRIHIPPHMAYGKEGAGRDIPPNSHLVFEVTLIGIK